MSLKLADSLLQEERIEQALRLYLEHLEIYPDDPGRFSVMQAVAEIYETRQWYNKAQKMYARLAEELGNSDAGLAYRFEQGRLLEKMGMYSPALDIYREITELSPFSETAAKAHNRIKLASLMQRKNSIDQTNENQTGNDHNSLDAKGNSDDGYLFVPVENDSKTIVPYGIKPASKAGDTVKPEL